MKKKCRVCGKSLSIYNKTGQCFHHTDRYIVKYKPITNCIGYERYITENNADNLFPKPGTEQYNNMAFTKEYIFCDDEDDEDNDDEENEEDND